MKSLVTSVAVFIVTLSACSGVSTPSCSDKDVQDLTIDISMDIVKRQMTFVLVNQAFFVTGDLKHEDINVPFLHLLQGGDIEGVYNSLSQFSNPAIQRIQAQVDEQFAKFKKSANLSTIRMSSQDAETKQVSCQAKMTINKQDGTGTVDYSIEYTAQYTEDGQVYVEAQVLEP